MLQLPSTARPIPDCPNRHADVDGSIYRERNGTFHILRLRVGKGGYLKFGAKDSAGRHKSWLVHRQVIRTFIGEPPSSNHLSRHLNGNPADNRLENLVWGTQRENVADMYAHGRAHMLKGKRLAARLTEKQARAIYAMKSTATCEVVAKKFRVKQKCVYKIWRGERWSHIHSEAMSDYTKR